MAIYQDLVDQHGFAGAYNSVKRFAGGLRERQPEQFDRLEFAPGEEAQVDYGEGALTRVAGTERYRKPRLFVMTLRYSRRSFRRVVWKSSQETWARLHEDAWRYFGGSTRYVVLDNLKEGVTKPDLYSYPKANDGKTVHTLTARDVPVDGFWSISVYNEKNFFEKNEMKSYSINNLTAKPSPDGSFTIQFGGCTKVTPNCLVTPAKWSYQVRQYRPRKEIIDGSWTFPQAQPVR
jgi:Protein of unknown function (DUF1214)/Integrase core domain